MNIAILSASRKVWLVQSFQRALAVVGGGRVWALDCDHHAAALQAADAAEIAPRSDAPEFLDWLVLWCRRERISLVVPTRDGELPLLAAAAERFLRAGVRVAVSPTEAVALCLDKRRFVDFCRAHGFDTPVEFAGPATAGFPAFVKPRRGQAGFGAERIDSAEALEKRGFDPEREILQEFVDAAEYTVDVFVDWDGRLISAVPRERVRVAEGESVVGRTVRDALLTDAAGRLALALGLRGHATVQAFRRAEQVLFIEVNPRFGGGAALGFAAGCPTPEWLVRLARGERIEPHFGQYEVGLWMFRHTADLFRHDAEVRR
ncbi:MAG TPA: ATP-grasp domain-containing protein [Opitutaceae bacterium]|nr:ATP-grasp domain-containing protein [Opitutaceae bacterium]